MRVMSYVNVRGRWVKLEIYIFFVTFLLRLGYLKIQNIKVPFTKSGNRFI